VIRTLNCDGEFRGMMEKVEDDLDVNMNFTNAQDYVPQAEQNNRTIKERIRAAYHRLPYKAIPRIMVRYLVMIQTNQLNLFPVKGGVSPYYSPHGATMSYGEGNGAVQSISRKQKLDTKSSTESGLVGVDDVSVMIFRSKLFL
jgi:hypothetical protein